MPSQHRFPARAFRPEPGEWEPAEQILSDRGETPGMFLRACLRWLASDPDETLAALRAHWPDVRPLGRPRQENRDDAEDSLRRPGLEQAPEGLKDEDAVAAADEDAPGAS